MDIDGYMKPYQRDMPFSGCHGNNLMKTTNFEIKWDQRRHDGVCVSSRPIRKGDRYKILIHGDGHILVGLINKPPSLKELHSGTLSLKAANLAVYQVRIKKFSSTVYVEYLEKKKITLQEGDGSSFYHHTLKDKESCYLCLELLFGNVEATLTSVVPTNNKTEDLLWSEKSGLNLQRSPTGSKMSLKHTNPLSLCGSNIPLKPYKTVKLMVDILPNCQYGYLSFAVSNRQPEYLHLNCLKRFYSDDILPHMSELKKIKVKESSDINILWDGGRNIKYFITSKEEKTVRINNVDITLPVYLIIEMFRIHVSIATVQIIRPPITMATQEELRAAQPMVGSPSTSSVCSRDLFQDFFQDCEGNRRRLTVVTCESGTCKDNDYLNVIPDPPIGCVPPKTSRVKPLLHGDNSKDGNRACDLGNERKEISEIRKKQTVEADVPEGEEEEEEECCDPFVSPSSTSNTNATSFDCVPRGFASSFIHTGNHDRLVPAIPGDVNSLAPRLASRGESDVISCSSISSYDMFGEGISKQTNTSSQLDDGTKNDRDEQFLPQDIKRHTPSLLLDIDVCENSFTEEEWLEILHNNQFYLEVNLNPLPAAHILHKQHYISVREYSTLVTLTGQKDQTAYFINLLKKRPHLSQQVLTALERVGQRKIAEHLILSDCMK